MTRRARLRDELRRLGNAPVPVLDPVRAERLERRVLDATRHRELELGDSEPVDTRGSSRRRSSVIALAAACVLAIVVVASLDRTGSSDRILFASGDVEVVLPDGSVVDGSTGMVVPDGSILRLGQRAEAEVDGITVSGAGNYRVTRDGLTLLTTSKPPESTPPTTTGDAGRSTITAAPSAVVPAPGRTDQDPARTVARPTTTDGEPATTVARVTTTARDTATTAARPPTSQLVAPPPADSLEPRQPQPPAPSTSRPDTTPSPSTTPTPSDSPAPLDVTVGSDGRRVVLGWRSVQGATGYVVTALPAVTDGASSWPPAPGVETTELPPGTLHFSVTRSAEGAWSYRVAAVGRNDRTLALSRVITIES